MINIVDDIKPWVELDGVFVVPVSIDGNDSRPILEDVNGSIRPGEWISILGANGSGKSTLAKVIAGFHIEGARGKIMRAISKHDTSPALIPIIMQQPDAGIVGATPWEDVVQLLERNGKEAGSIVSLAEAALQQVGLGFRMHQTITSLSGGQKQLTAIAGCLAGGMPILLLDEITSMLDPHASQAVLRKVRQLHQQGVSVVWITQKTSELCAEDRVWVMHDGKLVYDAQAEHLFTRKPEYDGHSLAEQVGLQAPYAIEVAWELQARGVALNMMPFTVEQLVEAVSCYVK